MRTKQTISVALFLMILLLGQAMTSHLNQIPAGSKDSTFESAEPLFSSNNSTGNNSSNDSHCMTVDNFTINSTYYVGIDLVNICSNAIQYPGVNTSVNHSGVSGFPNQTNWFYMIGANGTYNLTWQLSFNQSVVNGTPIQLDFEAHVLNCGPNNSWSHACPNSTFSHQFIFVSSNTGGNNTAGNNTGGNNTGGNNTGGNDTGGNTGCGYDANYSEVYSNLWSSQYYVNQTISSTLWVSCEVLNASMFLNYWIYDSSNYTVAANNITWVGSNNFNTTWSTPGLSTGNYTLHADLYVNGTWVDSYESSFGVISNNTGGNNTGGNNTGGNNTGGNNTGGNNTGGNNTDGNITVGNNTGGNNPNNNSDFADNDSDGVSDATDNCPTLPNANQTDNDGDGLGDACDSDLDGDGVDNQNDALPNNGNETIDTDNDGLGDNTDDDDDGDGMDDSNDAFPTDPTEQSDLDSDGVGDNLDADDDADGITDVTDNCPLIANADQADLDGDGVGTACDGMELGVDENGTITDGGDPIPSIGMLGTSAALSAGLLFAIRREDEE